MPLFVSSVSVDIQSQMVNITWRTTELSFYWHLCTVILLCCKRISILHEEQQSFTSLAFMHRYRYVAMLRNKYWAETLVHPAAHSQQILRTLGTSRLDYWELDTGSIHDVVYMCHPTELFWKCNICGWGLWLDQTDWLGRVQYLHCACIWCSAIIV